MLVALAGVLGGAVAESEKPKDVPLPKPRLEGPLSVERALFERRSRRRFAREPLVLAELGQLLWAAQGITGKEERRTAPSAGALYPLEVYVVAGRVEGLRAGVYHYRPHEHTLGLVTPDDRLPALTDATWGQDWVKDAPAVLVIAGVHERTTRKYGSRGDRYVYMEVGHAAQNVYLQATAANLATVMVGAFDDRRVKAVLELPRAEHVLGLMPVGHRRSR